MAIDTAAKRSSSLDHEEVFQWGAPLPDGAIGQGDRQHSIWSYSGILSEAAEAVLYGWLEYSLSPSRTHYRAEGKPHFTTSGKAHFTPSAEDQ